MGSSLQQWRAAIGGFHAARYCGSCIYFIGLPVNASLSEILFIASAVISILLVLGGVEQNPGPTVEELLINLESRISAQLTGIDDKVSSLISQMTDVKTQLADAHSKISVLQTENNSLQKQLNAVDRNVRKKNIIIFGLAYETNINVSDFVVKFLESKLNVM